MITIPTTLILGAGASHPYGFPLGSGLVQQILNPTDEDYLQLQELGIASNDVAEFLEELRLAEPPSIDFFLEHRPEFVEIGRLRISQQLIKCEIAEKLNSCDPNLHWYRYFLDKITASPERILENKVKIITFNYDRSLETYLSKTLQSRFGKNMNRVIELLDINHVHGKLGKLQWEQNTSPATQRNYYPDSSLQSLKIAADGIKIIFEADGDSSEFIAARETIANSERVYFLGFGYHAESLQRLGFPLSVKNTKTIHGSAFGFTKPEIKAIFEGVTHHHDEYSAYGLSYETTLEFLRGCKEQLNS